MSNPIYRTAAPRARAGSPCDIDAAISDMGFRPVRAIRQSRTLLPYVLFLVLATTPGCRQKVFTPLPTYDLTDDASAVRIIAERARAVRTVSSTCSLTLTRPDGQSVALDGILLAAPPDRLRLQASKLGRKLFDLTLNPDGLFVRVDDPSRRDTLAPATVSAAGFVREWATFTGGLFDAPDLTARGIDARTLLVTRPSPGGGRIECDVDRPTLTPRLYRLYDPAGTQRFTLAIPEYRLVGGVAYPDRMIATSPEQGTIDVAMREVELNVELPEEAFAPPARAVRQP